MRVSSLSLTRSVSVRAASRRWRGRGAHRREALAGRAASEEATQQEAAEEGSQVALHFIASMLPDGDVFQTTLDRPEGPLVFVVSSPPEDGGPTTPGERLLAAFSRAVIGLRKGDRTSVTLEPHEAYGELDPQLLRDVPVEEIRKGVPLSELEPGTFIALPDGRQAKVVALLLEHGVVRLNLNHPLAGLALEYSLVVDDVAPPGQLLARGKQLELAKVRHILVEDENAAAILEAQLAAGADFATLARSHSTCGSAAQGGEIGVVARGQTPVELDLALFGADRVDVDEVRVVRSVHGVHVLQVTDRPVTSD